VTSIPSRSSEPSVTRSAAGLAHDDGCGAPPRGPGHGEIRTAVPAERLPVAKLPGIPRRALPVWKGGAAENSQGGPSERRIRPVSTLLLVAYRVMRWRSDRSCNARQRTVASEL
jgi:hypothetical protein